MRNRCLASLVVLLVSPVCVFGNSAPSSSLRAADAQSITGVRLIADRERQAPVQTPTHRDSRLNGILIGAGIGAALGLFTSQFSDCPGDKPSGPCTGSRIAMFAFVAGTGALIGFYIDGRRDVRGVEFPQRGPGVRVAVRW